MELTFTRTHVSLGGLSRPFSEEDHARLVELAALPPTATPQVLLERGRELFAWLDGPARWLSEVPETLVIRAPQGSIVRDVPWELLADADGHLAARGLSVVHRLREAEPEEPDDDHRLGVLFMAAAPDNAVPLRFEDEEAAILRAVREPEAMTSASAGRRPEPTELDLFGEDTGNLDELVRRLDLLREHKIDVLHLSAHGSASPASLSMEDPDGGLDRVGVDRLVEALRLALPGIPLTFLSACETAKRGPAMPIAEALVRGGAPAALAWAGKVKDADATAFAAWLYHFLARGLRLDQSVAEARRKLLLAGRRDWHLARLFLGRSSGGPVAHNDGRSRPVSSARDPYILANISGRPRPVCDESAFVGRRRVLQRALRVLRRPSERRGIVLAAIGQQGKSSLAFRLGDRLRDHLEMVLIYGALDTQRLHARLAEFFGEPLDAPRHIEHAGADGRLRRALESWLREDRRPILLVLDDFEQNLEDTGAAWAPKPEARPAVCAVLGAFAACPASRSRLVVTSRAAFVAIDDQGRPLHECLEVVQVPEMVPAERSRLRTAGTVDAGLRQRVEDAGRGNPGLTEVLLRLAVEDAEACRRACDRLDAAEVPEGDVGETLKNIAMDVLLESARRVSGADELMQVALVFDLPVPPQTLDGVMKGLGFERPEAARQRLCALGILEAHRADRRLALNSLVAGRLPPLSKPEEADLVGLALESVRNEAIEEDLELGVQAFLLAAMVGDADVLARVVDKAVPALPALGRPRRTAPLAVAGCSKLLASGRSPTAWTLIKAADQGAMVGDAVGDLLAAAREVIAGSDLFTSASLLLREGRTLARASAPDEALGCLQASLALFQTGDHVYDQAVVLGEIARIRVSKGEVDEALRLHEEQLAFFERVGDARERAVTLGDVARIRVSKGEVDEALRLHEEQLAFFERVGDARERAVALGDIARIRVDKGEVEAALRLHEERLAVFERVGDAREWAVTLGDIARIRVDKGEVDEALRLHEERLAVFERLGNARSRAVTLGDIARIRASKGEVDEALRLHEEQLGVFERLGDARERAVTLGDIARIRDSKGEVDEALRLHEERLAVFERLGDARSRAVTLGDIARIRVSKGEVDEALRLHEERLAIFERLGDARNRAVTLGDIARTREMKGEVDEALRLHGERLAVFEHLRDVSSRALTLGDIARIRARMGEVDEALRIHGERLTVSERLGEARARAMTLGDIARIRAKKGEIDEALRLHEEQLAVFERFGDARERAGTLGDIAHIRAKKGEVDEALRLQTERLQVNRTLGDVDGIAAAQWDLAQLALQRGDQAAARTRLDEAFPILVRTGRADGLAIVGEVYGQLLALDEQPERAREVLALAARSWRTLGHHDRASQIDALAAELR